jgi:hypothetical protein
MTVGTNAQGVRCLEKARNDLQALARTADTEIGSLSRGFTGLAAHTDTILNLAAAIVGCAENENIASVLPKVQNLVAAARTFIADRLQATGGILETATREVKLLGHLSLVTRGQAAVARETKVLSVLTNIAKQLALAPWAPASRTWRASWQSSRAQRSACRTQRDGPASGSTDIRGEQRGTVLNLGSWRDGSERDGMLKLGEMRANHATNLNRG